MTAFNSAFQFLFRKTAGGYGHLFSVDAVASILKASNIIDVVLSDAPPGDITKLWFDPDSATPAPGVYKIWDTISASWVPLTPLRFAGWLVARSGLQPTPAGTIVAYGGAAAPAGWLLCNGGAFGRAAYAGLYAAIGDTFGAGNGTTTFNVPDLRGEFVRGADRMGTARGVDPGRDLGTPQGDQNKSHSHTGTAETAGEHTHTVPFRTDIDFVMDPNTGAVGPGGSTSTSPAGAHSHTLNINEDGGGEARPRNIALTYIIKT